MRDPDTPTKPGWYRCQVQASMDRPERWAAIDVVQKPWGLEALHFGSSMKLDWSGFLKWGKPIEMPPD